jgi:hypothetical protein
MCEDRKKAGRARFIRGFKQSVDQHTMVIQSNETGVRELVGPSVWGAGAGKELSRRPWNEGEQ